MLGPWLSCNQGQFMRSISIRNTSGAMHVHLTRVSGTMVHIIILLLRVKRMHPCDHKYDVTGSLCENSDKFAIDRMLPKIDMGDYLIIHDTGAHGFSMGYQYNGKLRSAELLLKEDGSVQMIRRAETIKDYYATFDFCDALDKLNLK